MSAGAAAAIKAAIAVLSNEEARKKVGWVIVSILSPLIVLVVLLCAILSGTSQHNVSAVELCFHGGSISASATPIPAEYPCKPGCSSSRSLPRLYHPAGAASHH